MGQYLPEGGLIAREDNRRSVESARALEECIASKRTVEAVCNVCDSNHNLIVDFGFMKGIVPRTEGAIGIDDGSTRDIALISRVNKPICFKVVGFTGNPVSPDTVGGDIIRCDVLNAVSNDPQYSGMVLLSRKQAQVECIYGYINNLKPGDIIPSKITHLEQFGCFVDIACGLPSLIPIDAISVSRISHPSDRFYSGQEALTVVKSIDRSAGEAFGSGIFPKITLTHKELLGTWEQNAASFAQGETVSGIVRSVESYGVFVELLPNLAGLAELRENIRVNQAVSVYIKAIIPEKMKIKLIIVDSFDEPKINYNYDYLIESDRIDKWVYSTDNSDKIIKTDFV
ncbi:MAG: S1 RNA-binding domain-containing protein [Oscillospiraceae bacterium]|nr:S1 RNA-binding domain-containing protein [Oscillospiraceae bacterium]